MRLTILFLILSFFSFNAQSYFIKKIGQNTNGNPGPMQGIPGDLFASTITFSNPSSSTIYVAVERFKNDIPAYWAVCYCYIQCHSPREDSILVEIAPFSSTDITLQFKTDSVNPGIAKEAFEIYETGFQNKADTLFMTASTMGDVGIKKHSNSNQLTAYPNPTSKFVHVFLKEEILESISIYDATGKLVKSNYSQDGLDIQIDFSMYETGLYLLNLTTDKNIYSRRLIKN